MNRLLAVTSIIEAATGLVLLAVPSFVVRMLLGEALGGPISLTVARVGGVALLTLGVACWLAHTDTQSRAARGLVSAMIIYNLGLALILGRAGFVLQTTGIALWPAVILHSVMAVWSIRRLPMEKRGWRQMV
jgi:hypothetical protein